MFGMFRPIAEFFDHSLDRILVDPAGSGYSKNMGAIGAVILGAFLCVFGALAVAMAGRSVEAPQYYLVRPEAKPARLPVLNSPAFSVEKITRWSERAVSDIFRFNFRDIDRRMAENSVYFTPGSWSDFKADMEKTEMVTKVKEQRQFVVLTPLEDAQLIGRAVVNGKQVLRVEVPVILTYIGGENPVYQRQFLELFILPVDTTEAPEGLAIAKLRAHPYN